jgi:hypothetical protein
MPQLPTVPVVRGVNYCDGEGKGLALLSQIDREPGQIGQPAMLQCADFGGTQHHFGRRSGL